VQLSRVLLFLGAVLIALGLVGVVALPL